MSLENLDARYFVYNFLTFLQRQITERKFAADIVESLEVAAQCLETAYDLPTAATVDEPESESKFDHEHPMAQVNVFDLFLCSCADVGPERKQEADIVKNEGNQLMKEEKYHEALAAYNKAIALDATNPVFYCNRAAAYSRMGDYQKAADDCKMSLRYDPTYSKAYGRLGIAYSKLNKHSLAMDAYINALRLDPENVDYQNNMGVTQQRLDEAMTSSANTSSASAAPQGSGFPALGNIDLMAAFNNPDIMSLAQRMMSDPSMQEIVSSIRGSNNVDSFIETGRQFVTQMQNQDTDFFGAFRDQMQANLRTSTQGTDNLDPADSSPENSQTPPPTSQ